MSNPRKHQHEKSDNESDNGDYRSFLHKAFQLTIENKFDCYLQSSLPDEKKKTLGYWKNHVILFPHLNLMTCDRFAVSVTDAEVECAFSKSGRVII